MFLETTDTVQVGERIYKYRNDFRLYIAAQRVLGSPNIFDADKLEVVCDILFFDHVPVEERQDVILAFLKVYCDSKASGQKCFDIEQDAGMVYAGFMQAYGIDLDTEEMTIERFLALLNSLPSDTRLAEVIRIRTMPIPKRTKDNGAQIDAILKAKHKVALKGTGSIAEGFKAFGAMVRSMAHGR